MPIQSKPGGTPPKYPEHEKQRRRDAGYKLKTAQVQGQGKVTKTVNLPEKNKVGKGVF